MTSLRGMELQRQKEIIERWLDTPGIPADAQTQLLEMLSDVNKEMQNLMTCRETLHDDRDSMVSSRLG